MSLRMSVSEREAFLAQARSAVLSIAEVDGGTVASPVWYLYERGGNITMHLNDPSVKLRALQQSGRATLTVQDEGDIKVTGRPLRYVSVTGSVVEDREFDLDVDGMEIWMAITRYLGKEIGQRYIDKGGESYLVGEPGVAMPRVIRLRPERWFTRDYGKAGEKWDEVIGVSGASAI